MEKNQNQTQNETSNSSELCSWNRQRSVEELRAFVAQREVALSSVEE